MRFTFQALCQVLLVALGALATTVHAQDPQPFEPQTAAPSLLTPPDWQLQAGATWRGGELVVEPAPADSVTPPAQRALVLPPGARWQARMTLAAVQPTTGDAEVGLTLQSREGMVVAIMVKPHLRRVVVDRGQSKWHASLLGPIRITGDRAVDPAAPVSLVVQGEDGRIQVWLDGVELGRSSAYDFEPVGVGVRAVGGQAVVRSLSVQAIGVDDRLARLSGSLRVPGAAVRLQETFLRSDKPAGMLGRLMGKAEPVPEGAAATDDWEEWSHADSGFKRDLERKRLVLHNRNADKVEWVSPAAYEPLDFAAVALTARVKLQATGAGNRVGLALMEKLPEASAGKRAGMVKASWGDNKMWLHEFDASRNTWQLLASVPWPAEGGIDVTLRLVARDSHVWLFVDGRLVIYRSNMERLAIKSPVLYAYGAGQIEASSFEFSEL